MNDTQIKDDVLSLIGKKTKEEAPKEELIVEEEPVVEEEKKEEDSVEEETTEILETEEETFSELEVLKKQNELLKAQLNEVSNKLLTTPVRGEDPKEESEEVDFLSGQDLEDILVDPIKLNALLNQVYKKAEASGYEKALKNIPRIVDRHINEQLTVKEKVSLFYKENPALLPVKDYVAKIASSIQSDHPDWGIDQIFAETKKIAEYTMGIDLTTAKPKPKEKPAFVKSKSSRGNVTNLKTQQQKDIEKLMALK